MSGYFLNWFSCRMYRKSFIENLEQFLYNIKDLSNYVYKQFAWCTLEEVDLGYVANLQLDAFCP